MRPNLTKWSEVQSQSSRRKCQEDNRIQSHQEGSKKSDRFNIRSSLSQFNECTSSGQKVYVSVYLLPAEGMLVCQPLHVLRFTGSYRHAGYGVGSGAHRLAEYHDIGLYEIPG